MASDRSDRIAMPATIDEIVETFALLDEWEDRYRYVIEVGKDAPPLPEADKNENNRVRGCASQVWLRTDIRTDADGQTKLFFRGESDAHIVQGLVAIIVAFYSGLTPQEIAARDVRELFARIGLSEHLTPQRSNGVRSMVERIRRDAAQAAS